jgi:starch phosphorylase
MTRIDHGNSELIRLLMEKGLTFDEALETVKKTCAYTNHTILAEALETWPESYLEEIVPQLIPIIEAIDDRVRRKYPDESVAVIDREDRVHMAHIDIHCGFSVNGVAELHTEILKHTELSNFYRIYPEKFNNKTNGITFRRWLLSCNPLLSALIREKIGDGFIKNPEELDRFSAYGKEQAVLQRLAEIKKENKKRLSEYLLTTRGIRINPDSVFDVQAKRLHEYKRQQLNLLWDIAYYLDLKRGRKPENRLTAIFAAKAAPAYTTAKEIIHAILCLRDVVDADQEVRDVFQIAMVENYNVSAAEKLIPACDISEQISLASKEASGTGNMKFMLNGAVTLGTEDGANAEIHRMVGDDNIYIFGMDSEEVIRRYREKDYNPRAYYEADPRLKEAVDFLTGPEMLARGDKEMLRGSLEARCRVAGTLPLCTSRSGT